MAEISHETPAQDALVDGDYYFLDVGAQKYGECTLAVFGRKRILIDGGHLEDYAGQDRFRSIPEQLAEILDEEAPHDITLLVVTHCHHDHVGCLPELVENGIIKPKYALVTDAKLGFGRVATDRPSDRDNLDPRARRLEAALREEDASDLTDRELRRFLDTVEKVESRYGRLLKLLRDAGTQVIPYRGGAIPTGLRTALRGTGFQVLGPSQDQLVYCAEQIQTTNKDAIATVDRLVRTDAEIDDVSLYRRITERDERDAKNPRGNGMNCQSITIALGKPEHRALLAGDMQFTDPGVRGADDEVAALRARVADAGPYRLFKTTHHTSHNGQDAELLDELGSPALIVHSGGRRDATHPDPGVLQDLKQRTRTIRFARTDRHGLIKVSPHLDDDEAIVVSRKSERLNNFTPNDRDAELETATSVVMSSSSVAPTSATATAGPTGSSAQVIIVNIGDGPIDLSVGGVHIVSRGRTGAAHESAVSSPPTPPPNGDPRPRRGNGSSTVRLAGGRDLPRLLFVTDADALESNVGGTEARAALDAVKRAGHPLCEIDRAAMDPVGDVRAALRNQRDVRGVVILGGYDVVPSIRVDVLDAPLRAALGASVRDDDDRFIVWSDEPYGDTDGDRIGELPVSRVPDGRDAQLFLGALAAGAPTTSTRFGVRNIARPFADLVWNGIGGSLALNVSEKFLASGVRAADAASSCHYFMLHGDASDGSTFLGEVGNGAGYTLAFDRRRIPAPFTGVVFTGCCWGALIVEDKAYRSGNPAPRVVERSIALSYLKAGANAFVGCTGSHYSGPDVTPDDNYALDLHLAFWSEMQNNQLRAAPALFAARRSYSQRIAQRRNQEDAYDLARRLKNRTQFTCLGLGW